MLHTGSLLFGDMVLWVPIDENLYHHAAYGAYETSSQVRVVMLVTDLAGCSFEDVSKYENFYLEKYCKMQVNYM